MVACVFCMALDDVVVEKTAGVTSTRPRATARGREDEGGDIGRRGQPLQDREPLPGAEKTEGTT